MPTILYASATREAHDGFTLSITARHALLFGGKSSKMYHAKGRIPNIDIITRGDLVLCLSGMSNSRPVAACTMKCSALSERFRTYLKTHANSLGMSTVSELYVDDDGAAKFNLSPSAPYEPEAHYPVAYLSEINITFAFYSKDKSSDDIFSRRMFLPFKTALDALVDKFVTIHLARRYPLIFGSLRRKLQMERSYCSPMSNSVLRVAERSPNNHFRREVTRLFSGLNRKLSRESQNLTISYCRHAGINTEDKAHLLPPAAPNDDLIGDAVLHSLFCILRSHVRPSRFKGSGSIAQCSDEHEPPDDFPFTEIDDNPTTVSLNLPRAFPAISWDDLPVDQPGSISDDSGCMKNLSTLPDDGRSAPGDDSGADDSKDALLYDAFDGRSDSDSDDNWDLDNDTLECCDTPDSPSFLRGGASEDGTLNLTYSRGSSQSEIIETPSNSQTDALVEDFLIADDAMSSLCAADGCSVDHGILDLPGKYSDDHCENRYLVDSDDELPLFGIELRQTPSPVPCLSDAPKTLDTLSDRGDLPVSSTHQDEQIFDLRCIFDDDDDEVACMPGVTATFAMTSGSADFTEDEDLILMDGEDAVDLIS